MFFSFSALFSVISSFSLFLSFFLEKKRKIFQFRRLLIADWSAQVARGKKINEGIRAFFRQLTEKKSSERKMMRGLTQKRFIAKQYSKSIFSLIFGRFLKNSISNFFSVEPLRVIRSTSDKDARTRLIKNLEQKLTRQDHASTKAPIVWVSFFIVLTIMWNSA